MNMRSLYPTGEEYNFTGDISVNQLIEQYGAPLYVYDFARIKQQYEKITKAFNTEEATAQQSTLIKLETSLRRGAWQSVSTAIRSSTVIVFGLTSVLPAFKFTTPNFFVSWASS